MKADRWLLARLVELASSFGHGEAFGCYGGLCTSVQLPCEVVSAASLPCIKLCVFGICLGSGRVDLEVDVEVNFEVNFGVGFEVGFEVAKKVNKKVNFEVRFEISVVLLPDGKNE